MCLIVFARQVHPQYPLVFAANRDEFLDRPTAPAAYWAHAPGVLGGRDLEKGGSWFATDKDGRWAAVTNYREGIRAPSSAPSRGALIGDYLTGSQSAASYMETVQAKAATYPGFNLLVADAKDLYYLSNREAGRIRVNAGIHGLSNKILDTPWPKVSNARQRLGKLMDLHQDALIAGLFDILLDRSRAPDHELPETGVGLDWERTLSAPFIVSEGYGTRASTVLLIDHQGNAIFEERCFGQGGRALGRQQFSQNRDGRPAQAAG